MARLQATVLLLTTGALSALTPKSGCPDLTTADRSRILTYVQKKFKVESATGLSLKETLLPGTGCYRELQVQSIGGKRRFSTKLFAAPGLRFLSQDLMDTTLDPVAEERREHAELLAGLTAGNYPMLGDVKAPVVLTVFSDFQCPYCAKLARMLKTSVLPVSPVGVRMVFRHFPLAKHDWAREAARASICANQQSQQFFWRLHDHIFDNQTAITKENARQKLVDYVSTLRGADLSKFKSCVAGRDAEMSIERDIQYGARIGIRGTPTLFVNGMRLASVVAPEQILTLIRQAKAE